jgi:hypothetical protein
MNIGAFDELIQIEAEQIAEDLYGSAFFDLPPQLKLQARAHAIDLLSPTEVRLGLVPAA